MVSLIMGEAIPQQLESQGLDGGNVSSCVVEYVGVGSFDLFDGFRCYNVVIQVAISDG